MAGKDNEEVEAQTQYSAAHFSQRKMKAPARKGEVRKVEEGQDKGEGGGGKTGSGEEGENLKDMKGLEEEEARRIRG